MESKSIPQFQSSLGFYGIIKESFKTAIRNRKLLVPTLLLVFLTSSQLDVAQKYVLTPVSRDFLLQMSKHSNMVQDFSYSTIDYHIYDGALDDLREILLVKLLFMAVTSIITLVFLIVTVSSTYEAYTAKLLGLKDIMSKIKKSWKRPIVTSFYMTLLSLGLAFFYTISIGISSILAVNSWALMFLGAITLSIPVCYYYVATLWTVSMIVSVLEDGVGGLKAIGRAAELIKGKRLQASLMMVLFSIAYGLVLLIANFLRSYNRTMSAELLITIPFTSGFYCLLKLFMFVVYTVFYHERKTSHDEKEGKGVYIPIAAGEV
uniref:Dual specificity protein kinase n=1 Tax=Tanacetum cinerariifolium TaxID=118510 RepID=A0A6L2M912_TANCI|nr:dual specificity protein kinase [Tanacetum cinerariifolium]